MLAAAGAAVMMTGYAGYAAYAASPAVVQAIKARKANYKEIGGAFKTINDEVKTGAPDTNSIRSAAQDLLTRASGQVRYFPKGSGPESGEKTRAKAEIWTNAATFAKYQRDFVASADGLNKAIAAGNNGAIASYTKALGTSCKTCHDAFRAAD